MEELSIALANYPLVIEPTTVVLEVKVGASADPAEDRWSSLHRVPIDAVRSLVSGIPDGIVHFFGKSVDPGENAAMLCYSVGGRLSHFMHRYNGQWALTTVPDELVGKPTQHPSLRFVFEDERARSSFLYYVRSVIDGKIHNPSLAIIFDKLAEPVRALDVWVAEQTTEENDA